MFEAWSQVSRKADGAAQNFLDSVGVNVHLGHPETQYLGRFRAKIVPMILNLGVKHIRDDIILPARKSSAQFAMIKALVANGRRFSLVCYDRLNEYTYTDPAQLAQIYKWCDGGVEIFEGSNEPDLKDNAARAYISSSHQAELFAAVKREAFGAEVMVAGPSYIQKNVEAARDLSSFVDLGNIHPYPGNEHPEARTTAGLRAAIQRSRRIFGSAQVVASETGYHTALSTRSAHMPISEAMRARYLPRMLIFNHLCGVRRSYIYELLPSFDRGLGDPESCFGLVDQRGNRTASFFAIQALLKLLSDATLDATESLEDYAMASGNDGSDLVVAGFQRRDGTVLRAIWMGVSGWDVSRQLPQRPLSLHVEANLGSFNEVRAHRFSDSGMVSVEKIATNPDGLTLIEVSDCLTLLECH